MGADEKHAATYHGGEYTPTTAFYVELNIDLNGNATQTNGTSFYSWLETVRAEAKAEALEELADTYGPLPNFQMVLLTRAARMRARANQYKENQS